jgi:hypothetical protein
MDIIFLIIIGYALYRWGHKHGKVEGYRESYQSDVLMRMEDYLDKNNSE